MSQICDHYELTVTRKDGTLIHQCNINAHSLEAALVESARRVVVLSCDPTPRHDVVLSLVGVPA